MNKDDADPERHSPLREPPVSAGDNALFSILEGPRL